MVQEVALNDRFYKVLRMRIPHVRFIYKPNAFFYNLEGLHLGRQLFFILAVFPSGLRPENRASLPPEKKQAQKNKPPRQEKNKLAFVFSYLPRTAN